MAATVKKTFDIALDIAASSSNRAFTVVEGDTGNVLRIAPPLIITTAEMDAFAAALQDVLGA